MQPGCNVRLLMMIKVLHTLRRKCNGYLVIFSKLLYLSLFLFPSLFSYSLNLSLSLSLSVYFYFPLSPPVPSPHPSLSFVLPIILLAYLFFFSFALSLTPLFFFISCSIPLLSNELQKIFVFSCIQLKHPIFITFIEKKIHWFDLFGWLRCPTELLSRLQS